MPRKRSDSEDSPQSRNVREERSTKERNDRGSRGTRDHDRDESPRGRGGGRNRDGSSPSAQSRGRRDESPRPRNYRSRERSESPRNTRGDNNREDRSDKEDLRTSREIHMKKHEKSEERRRYLKWLSFTKSKIAFGFQHLAKEYVPVMSENFHGYSLCLEKVSGWSIPMAVTKEFRSDGDIDFEVSVQLSMSMFHIPTASFFGSTWMGVPVSLGEGDVDIPRVIDFEYNDIVYLMSRIIDTTCVAIIEVVVSKFDMRKRMTAAQFGCGWTIINLFNKPSPPDIASGYENGEVVTNSVFAGSPRDLLINTDIKTLANRLKQIEIPDCHIMFKLFEHKKLLRSRKLIGENEALGRFDPVPGLVQRSVIPPGSTKPRDLACLGDEEMFDNNNGVRSMPMQAPRFATPITLRVENCQLFIPGRKATELKMIDSFAKLLNVKDKSVIRIVSRTLRAGLHNGNTVVGGEWKAFTLLEDKTDHDILMTKEEVLSLNGFAPDGLMALAFLIEYEMGMPITKNTHFNSQAIMRATVMNNGKMITTFTFGSAIFLPCDDDRLLLKNTDKKVGDDDDGVDVELKLLSDETCSILSPKPLLLDHFTGGAEGKDVTSQRVLGEGPQEKKRVTLVAGETGGDKLEADDYNIPLLGFDLKAHHPHFKELMHLEDIAPLLQYDQDGEGERVKKPVEEKEEDGDEGKLDDSHRKVFKKTYSESSVPSNTLRDELLRDLDDIRSIPDSIVTGGSDRSSLRLEALYYTSDHPRRERDSPRAAIDWDNRDDHSIDDPASHFAVPRDRNSLLAQSLQTRMVTRDRVGPEILRDPREVPPTAGVAFSRDYEAVPVRSQMQIAPKTKVAIDSNANHIRELSRGARSRLNRYGYEGAIVDTALDQAVGISGITHQQVQQHRAGAASGKNIVVDIDLEARDELSLHEISIQFAGFRPGAKQLDASSRGVDISQFSHIPHSVYFSFQFYTCAPTRTEVMRLLPAEVGQLCVLARDEAYARDETPLTLRFMIDCSTSSPNEAREFADFMAHNALYIDVWDADSLIQLGTIGIPLRRLMRQQRSMMKFALECDVINADIATKHSRSGVQSTVIADGGPVAGVVTGAVQVILANHGQQGKGPKPKLIKLGVDTPGEPLVKFGEYADDDDFESADADNVGALRGMNWRAYGVQQGMFPAQFGAGLGQRPQRAKNGRVLSRPKNSVRARPLSENVPELSKALSDVRLAAERVGGARTAASMRSLMPGSRGGEGSVCTLTYDEVAIIFRRFRGRSKGTVQYAGDLIALLDMPSLGVALKKLVQAYRKFGDHEGLMREMLRFSNANSELGLKDLQEFFRQMFDKTNISVRHEELVLLAQKFVGDAAHDFVTATQVVDFCAEEADRQEWLIVSNRVRLCAQKAALEGGDVEQMLADKDSAGSHYINVSRFKDFLRELGKYGSLTPKDVNMCCRHFARRPRHAEEERDPIALKDVMAFLGVEYVGNLQVRIRKVLEDDEKGAPSVQEMLRVLDSACAGGGLRPKGMPRTYAYDEVESAWGLLGIFKEITHAQGRTVIKKLDAHNTGKLTAAQLLLYLGVPFHANDLKDEPHVHPADHEHDDTDADAADPEATERSEEMDAEDIFKLLLEKVRSHGVAVDEAFRHFDANGDGSITRQEFIRGLSKLGLFENLPNWKKYIPGIVAKFDKNNDGEVNLREFFAYLGITEYAPDIIQRMTKIFAVATQNKVSIKDIFKHLDSDGSGNLDASEIEKGLRSLGSNFGEVSREDAEQVVARFDTDGDKEVSIDEFVEYFTARVQQALKDRRRSRTDKVAAILRRTFMGAAHKGTTLRSIFDHLDKDHGGSVDTKELALTIRKLPSFKKMSEQDVEDLVQVLDEDGSGDITFDEFEAFVMGDGDSTLGESMISAGTGGGGGGGSARGSVARGDRAGGSLIDRIRDTFRTAESKGLSFEKAFELVDADHSGELGPDELAAILKRLPNFRHVSNAEVQQLFDIIDADHSGYISVSEFRDFVREGKVVSDRRAERKRSESVERKSASPPHRRRDADPPMNNETAKEMLIRHVRRIAQIDGSISGLLAYLDDDEDGLISLTAFKMLLRREEVYDTLPEEKVVELLEPLMQDDKHIRSAALLRFLEGKSGGGSSSALVSGADRDGDLVTMPRDYTFSNDPEIRSLEKKVRGFGRVLAKRGVDVESIFRNYDAQNTGSVRRTELIEVLSKLGMYILEQGKVLDQALHAEQDTHRQQMRQVNKLKGVGGAYVENAPRMARRMLMNDGGDNAYADSDFKDHLESMTLVNWYRQSQKQLLLQRVLSHSLAQTIRVYPRFGCTLFFEYPITNPFAHEERFQIEINDPELRLVTAFDEWLHLRKSVAPCIGELGQEPIEADMFDKDANNNVQVALLPHETLHLPFTFMTLLPFSAHDQQLRQSQNNKLLRISAEKQQLRGGGEFKENSVNRSSESKHDGGSSSHSNPLESEEPKRVVEVRVLSGTHGHIVCILRVMICLRPFVVHRTLRFQEAENSIMKQRVQVVGHENMSLYPGEFSTRSKYVHCVESTSGSSDGSNNGGDSGSSGGEQSRVVVEWGPSSEHFSGQGSLDMLIRYRCGPFPSAGSFYLLIYNDPYQSQLHEVWQVLVQTRQRLDIHGSVGAVASADLVVRGDKFPRRACAFATPAPNDFVSFRPDGVFQLVPGAYNRIALSIHPRSVGFRQLQLNLVDADSRELISGWLVSVSATSPAVMRSYDVEVAPDKPLHKKIIFKNPWDVPRKFQLSSSDDSLMRPRNPIVEVGAHGSTYLRLLFSAAAGFREGTDGGVRGTSGVTHEVHLFLNDAIGGQNEECYLFRIKEVISA